MGGLPRLPCGCNTELHPPLAPRGIPMLTLGVVLALEVFLPLRDRLDFPATAEAGLVAILLLGLTITPSADAKVGFISRLSLLLSMVWYLGSLGRWLPHLDVLYGETPGPASEVLALAVLVVAPLAMIAGPLLIYVPRNIDLRSLWGGGG